MIKLYSSHCPQCMIIEQMLKNKKIEFEIIDDEKIYFPIAEKNDISSMPFADIDGEIMNTNKLKEYIKKGNL